MEKQKRKSAAIIVLQNIGWPLFWGLSLTAGFYALTQTGIIQNDLLDRYFSSHPVQYFETALFFIGVSALVLKVFNAVGQFGTMAQIEIVDRPAGGQSVDDASGMLSSLRQLPADVRQGVLARRLEEVLQFVARKGSADGLDNELTRLSDLDAARQHDGFALVRIIIWATPMLGFLGTVIGITLALADLSPQALVSTPETAMEGLLAGLAVAFDTTALALVLAILLMFAQFVTNRLEMELIEAVDRRVSAEMVGRFRQVEDATPMAHEGAVVSALKEVTEQLTDRLSEITTPLAVPMDQPESQQRLIEAIERLADRPVDAAEERPDVVDQEIYQPLIAAIDRLVASEPAAAPAELDVEAVHAMTGHVVQSMEDLVARQAQLWNETIDEAQTVWHQAAHAATSEIQAQMSATLSQSMQQHSDRILQEQSAAVAQLESHWAQLQSALSQNAHVMQNQQAELVRQGDALLQTVDGLGQVTSLQDSLDQNLARLVSSSSLNETMMSLNSAINLLNARLTPSPSAEMMRIYQQPQRGNAA